MAIYFRPSLRENPQGFSWQSIFRRFYGIVLDSAIFVLDSMRLLKSFCSLIFYGLLRALPSQ